MTNKKTGRRKAAKKKPGRPRGANTVYPKDPNGNRLTRFSSQHQPNTKVVNGTYRYVPDPVLKQKQRVVKRRPSGSKLVRDNKEHLLERLRRPPPKAQAQPYKGDRPPRSKPDFIKERNKAIVKAFKAAQALLPLLKRKPVRAGSERKRKRRTKGGWVETAQLLADPLFGKYKPHRNTITKVVKKSGLRRARAP